MRRRAGLNMVEKALIAAAWESTAITAEIHALIGDNSHAMVNQAGRVFFVILGASMAQGIDPDDRDMRIVRGAVNAVHDQAGEQDIPESRRASIVSGLLAATRLRRKLSHWHINRAACDLAIKLHTADISLSDFEALIGATA